MIIDLHIFSKEWKPKDQHKEHEALETSIIAKEAQTYLTQKFDI